MQLDFNVAIKLFRLYVNLTTMDLKIFVRRSRLSTRYRLDF